ncbi:MAG: hypothetical protein V1871_00530 [Planctomycetota bacterium]
MKRFTDAIRKAIHDENWFAGLFLALCMPDICGSLEKPDVPVGERYKAWFNDNLSQKYSPRFSADDCFYFRCSCLHQGFDSHEKLTTDRIHFITPPPRGIMAHLNMLNNILQMQIDIFCTDIADAVDYWNGNIAKNNPDIQSRINKLMQIYPPESIKPFILFGESQKLTSPNSADLDIHKFNRRNL